MRLQPIFEFITGLVGFVGWNFLEYALHQVAHRRHLKQHAAHHAGQTDKAGRFLTVTIPFLVVVIISISPGIWRGFLIGSLLEICVLVGFHHLFHRESEISIGWLARLRLRHKKHHAHCYGNFGTTTAVWDRLLGTEFK